MNPNEFIEHYEKFLLGDIDAMMEKADQMNSEGKFGNQMAVPIAFSIFASLDIYGFLIRNSETDEKNVKNELKDSTVNIAKSMLWYNFDFPEFEIQNVPSTAVKNRTKKQSFIDFQATALYKFIDIYRHGIMHTFFPKAFTISNKKEGESRELFYKKDGILVFNVRKFHSNFKSFLAEIKNQLTTDANFNQRIEENINRVFKNDSSFDDFLNKIFEIHTFNHSYNSGDIETTDINTTESPNQNIHNNI